MRLDARDLVDLRLDLCQQLAVRRHYFRNYSFGTLAIVRRCPRSVVSRSSSARSRSRRSPSSPSPSSLPTGAPERRPLRRAPHRSRAQGRPPLSFALGFRTDPEARDLLKGQALYARGELAAAAALFAKHDSLEGKVGAALAGWPEGSLDRLEQLAKLYPDAAVVQLHLGLARLWANEGDPTAAWRSARRGGARHALRRRRRQPAAPEPPARAPGVHPLLLGARRDHEASSRPSARGAPRRRRARRASRAALVRRRPAAGRAARLGGARLRSGGAPVSRRRRRRRSPAPWGSSTRTLPSARSAASARSRVRTPTSRRSGSISASCFSGRDGSTRRSASSGWRRRRSPARHSPERPFATSRRSARPALETALTTAALVTTL